MFKKRILFILIASSFALFTHAQKEENVWIFGGAGFGGMGLDFNAGSPPDSVGTPGYFDSYEATASICDGSTGQLLFYTDGDTLYNKNGDAMPNGKGLTGMPSLIGASPTSSAPQGALIVPMPNQKDKYYVFSLTDLNAYLLGKIMYPGLFQDQSGYLFYSVVDMALQGGLGDVVAGKKGLLIDSTTRFTEHMIGIAGNNCNVWVVLLDPQRETNNITRFKSFEVTENGVNAVPVISNVFSVSQSLAPYNTQEGMGQSTGHLAVSPNRKKIALGVGSALTKQRLVLFDFDANIGLVSNPLLLDTAYSTAPQNQYYGVCFSPDNSKLYANDWGHFGQNKIYQFDVSSNNANTIINTRTTVAESSNYFSGIKRGFDDKLYYFYSENWIGVINDPNNAGITCNADSTVIQTEANVGKNFPNNVPIVALSDPLYSSIDTILCSKAGSARLDVASVDGSEYLWENGITTSGRDITQSGTYWVQYKENGCQIHVDTFHVAVIELNPLITIREFDLSTTSPYSTYQWMLNENIIQGANNSIYTVTENGNYQVIVTNEVGCIDTSEIYEVTNVTGITDALAIKSQIRIYPNPTNDIININAPLKVNISLTDLSGKRIQQLDDASRISIKRLPAGTYLLRVTDKKGTFLKVEKIVKSK